MIRFELIETPAQAHRLVDELRGLGVVDVNYVGDGPAGLLTKIPSYLMYAVGRDTKTDRLVVCGGVEQYYGETHINKRLWVNPADRGGQSFPIAPLIVLQTLILDQVKLTVAGTPEDRLFVSFNWANRSVYNGFVRMASGKSSSLSGVWPNVHRTFQPLGTRTIHGVLQFVCASSRDSVRRSVAI